jgi:hypothetical protein
MSALLATLAQTATTLAAIGWDPEIRGILTVVVAVVILCGSVYLIVATNVGSRLGFLIALSGLFGWFVTMGIIWWIYGIGRIGRLPSWEIVEVNYGDTSQSENADVRELPAFADLPTGAEVLEDNPELAEQFVGDPDVTLAEIAAADPTVLEQYDFGGWSVLSSADVGEAQASADAYLVEAGFFGEPTEYVLLEGYETGGKEERSGDSFTDRISNKVEQLAQITHPPHYAVIQVQAVVPQETEPGQAAPTPEADETQPVISVVMERDIGERRLPPALFTIGSAILFAITVNMLNRRDLAAKAARDAAASGAKA